MHVVGSCVLHLVQLGYPDDVLAMSIGIDEYGCTQVGLGWVREFFLDQSKFAD